MNRIRILLLTLAVLLFGTLALGGCALKELQPHEKAVAISSELATSYKALHQQYLILHDTMPDRRDTLEHKVAPVMDASKHAIVLLGEAAHIWRTTKEQPGNWAELRDGAIRALGDAARLLATATGKEG